MIVRTLRIFFVFKKTQFGAAMGLRWGWRGVAMGLAGAAAWGWPGAVMEAGGRLEMGGVGGRSPPTKIFNHIYH